MGTWGDTGCFSFQASKNLNSGEGGAILSNNEELVEKCYAFHNNCRARQTASYNFTYLGSAQSSVDGISGRPAPVPNDAGGGTVEDARAERAISHPNAVRIPGILPARQYEGCTRNAYHLYMFRYKQEQFGNLGRNS